MCFILKKKMAVSNSKDSHFQNKVQNKYSCKNDFIHMIIKKKHHFHVSGLGLSLTLKQRFWATRKWPVKFKLQLTRLGRGTQKCSPIAQG